MATIDPNQTYDVIHTLTFAEASGTCKICLYRGSSTEYTGTVYYRAGDVALPTTTVVSKTMYLGFIYNEADSKWDFVAFVNNF